MGTVPNHSHTAHADDPNGRSRLAWPQFDPDALGPGYVYVKLADYIAARIAEGLLRTGAMLPCERSLAAEYGVSVGTARRAVQLLRERKLVITLPSRGTYVHEHSHRDSRHD